MIRYNDTQTCGKPPTLVTSCITGVQ